MPNAGRLRLPVCLLMGLCLGTGLVAWSARSLRAQQATSQVPSPPVFRGGTTFVSVDVYPRLDGAFVDGLGVDDFQVFEDGVPQRVESFQIIRNEPNPADGERRDPNTQADSDTQAADPRNRVFVVYLDLRHTTIAGSHYARQPVVDFLTRTIGRNDLFGVLTQEVPVGQLVFARRTETLEAELVKYWPWGQLDRSADELRTPLERRLAVCEALTPPGERGAPLVELSRDDLLMTSLEHLVRRLGDLRDERKNVLFISEGWVPRGPRPDLLNATVSQGDIPAVGVGPGGRIGIGNTMQPYKEDRAWCDSEIARLASIDFEKRFLALLEAAVQANVSFYPVDVGGLRTQPTRATDTLRTLAENTDGFAVVSTNDLVGSVRRINDDLSAFYLLGYHSTNPAANGRFRKIEVKVARPDVRVSARRGYLAPTAEMAAAAAAPRVSTGPSAVDEAIGRLAFARADTELFVSAVPVPDGLHVVVELPVDVAARDGWKDGATVQATATGGGGRTASAGAAIEAGARVAALTIPDAGTTPGTWQVAVQAEGRDQRLNRRVEIDVPAARLVGQALAWRAASSPRAPLRPLADARLTRIERLRVEWPVMASAETHVARLLDRSGKPLGQPLPVTSLAPDRQAVAVDLPMSALPEGDYVIELVATRAGESERRLLPFRVVR